LGEVGGGGGESDRGAKKIGDDGMGFIKGREERDIHIP
jgi:hypothetical protein